jgi:hypothetical protein
MSIEYASFFSMAFGETVRPVRPFAFQEKLASSFQVFAGKRVPDA